ncbi:MAG: phosphotransferase, partial [Nitrososphaerota archaeon]
SDWPVAFQEEFARTLAAIHRGTDKLADVLPPRESFALSFEHDLLASLPVIAGIGPRSRPGLRALRDLMRVRGDEIRAQVERLRHWQARICTSPYPAVLCHTDMSGDNLLVDEHGHLYVLDWDEAVVASPEYDLKEAAGEHIGRVVEVYRAAGGAHPLEVDRFAFYLLRRYLEDLTARITSIVRDNTTQEQDNDDLAGIEIWGFAQWNRLDAALATIATALRDLQ